MYKICLTYLSLLICSYLVLKSIGSISNSLEATNKNLNYVEKINYEGAIQTLGMNQRRFKENILNSVIICTEPHKKSLLKLWSSAVLNVKSLKHCDINLDVNATNILTNRNKFSFLSSILTKLKSFQESSTDLCQHVIPVELFVRYCIEVKLNGQLEVEYEFTNVDFKIVIICLLGIILFYTADRLSKNELFQYFSGMSLGVFGSIIILLIILMRFIPRKAPAIFALITGSSFFLFLTKWIYFNFKNLTTQFQMAIIVYVVSSALISVSYCYYRGPIQNERATNIIQFVLRVISICLIYCGTSYKELSVSLITAFILVNCLYQLKWVLNLPVLTKIRYNYFPPTRRLLTHDEYVKEGQEYTIKALQELRDYCNSPDCNVWRTVSRISRPEKFAKFVSDGSFHLSDDEINDYENSSILSDLIDDDDYDNED